MRFVKTSRERDVCIMYAQQGTRSAAVHIIDQCACLSGVWCCNTAAALFKSSLDEVYARTRHGSLAAVIPAPD